MNNCTVTVSVIIPAHNCEQFIEQCLSSITEQEFFDVFYETTCNEYLTHRNSRLGLINVEISIYEDASSDATWEVIQHWLEQQYYPSVGEDNIENPPDLILDNSSTNVTTKREAKQNQCHHSINYLLRRPSTDKVKFSVKLSRNDTASPKGVGFARNRAVEQSVGDYLCFCDADDIMMPKRISKQLTCAWSNNSSTLIGTKFIRLPPNSMKTLTKWANNLKPSQLYTQIYSSFGPTLIMPTWFCAREVFETVGGFNEDGYGVAEDLIFFYKHLSVNGELVLVDCDEPLMIYRHHALATTFSVSSETIWNLRLERLQSVVLSKWNSFTIWNAGKLGRRLFRSLSPENKLKVDSFCDVDEKKICQRFYEPYPMKCKIRITNFKEAKPPFVICVKIELTCEEEEPSRKPNSFLSNLEALKLVEGLDYVYFN